MKRFEVRSMAARAVTGAMGMLLCATLSAEVPVQPQPAEAYPMARDSLLLDVVDTGDALLAVGMRGHILRSTEGERWQQVNSPVDRLLTAISFADAKRGWAVGHDAAILNTSDGGETWALQHFDPQGQGPLLDVYFENAQRGYAIGAFGTFLGTNDGGQSWAPVDAPAVSDAAVHLYAMTRTPAGRYLMVGEMGSIFATDENGDWQQLDSPYDGSFYDVQALGAKGVLAVGMRGNAYVTTDLDEGQWRKIESDTLLGLTSITPLTSKRMLVTGLNRSLWVLDAPGHMTPIRVQDTEASNTGSLNAAVVRDGQIYLAGDQGIKVMPVPPEDLASVTQH